MPFHLTTEKELAVRRWKRLQIDMPVCVIVTHGNKTTLTRGRLKNISEDGVAIFAGVELRIDAEVFVEFTPAFEGSPMRVCGVVRHRQGYVYGLEFMPRDTREESDLASLKRLLMAAGAEAEGSIEDRRS
jgi:PilZ domain